ncbi:MAG: Fe-S cluster assembly protein SufD [Tissierellia bacterium]|nr:Fe-S cluster assembly protein SufD [Tissierellia bacterium]
MIEIKDELNSIPVKTYRWLNVNHLKIDEVIRKDKKPYSKKFVDYMDDENISIGTISNIVSINQHLNKIDDEKYEYGVSKKMVELAENSYNAGVYAYIKRGANIEKPIRIQYAMDKENDLVIDNNIIVASENSRATIVIDYYTLDDVDAFHNGALKIFAKPGANITVIKIQRMNDNSCHFDSNLAIVEPGAEVDFIQVEFGSKRTVTNYISNIKEEGRSSIDSIYLGDKDRELDLSYYMNHIGRRSISNIETRGALKDKAKKIFKGTIDFKKGSSKSIGKEEESVILLDKTVISKQVPLLLCTEDDVIGEHAASSGKVDEDKLFYMMSRGFSKKEALKALVEASFNPIIDKIPMEDIKNIVKDELARKLVMEDRK